MITDIFFLIVGAFLFMVSHLLAILPFTIPSVITTAIAQYAGYLHYAQGVLPIVPNSSATGLWQSVGMITIFGWGIDFIIAWYTMKLILWAFAMIPWVGRHVSLPSGGSSGGIHEVGPTEQIGGEPGHVSLRPQRDAYLRRKN